MNLSMKRIRFIFPVFISFIIFPYIRGQSLPENQIVQLDKGEYILEALLESMDKLPGITLSYNSNDLPLDAKIHVPESNPSLQQLINYIETQSPSEVIIKGNFLIIRRKQLQDHYEIRGKVTDIETGEAMVGLNVYVKKSGAGTVTDANGSYSLNLTPGNYTLVFSFIGYAPQEEGLNAYSNQTLDVRMTPEQTELDEVRIIGERQFFGSLNEGRTIETIELKEVELVKTNNVTDVLQARLPGVWVTKVSGAPGDHNQVRIRGINSLFGGVDPLYVIDGVPVPIVNLHTLGISDLNIHDVENITVLKDASSNAIYGFQGGNGVIIIDTRRGGEKGISFSVTQGIQEAATRYDLFNSEELVSSLDSAARRGISSIRSVYPDFSDTLSSDDWQDRLLRRGWISEYQLSGGGTLLKTQYYLSGNYYRHDGVIENTGYSKYTLSASLGRNFFDRLSVEGVYKACLQQNRNNLDSYWGNHVILEEINKSPSYNSTPIQYYEDTVLNREFVRTYIDYPDLHTRENPDDLINLTNKKLDVVTHNVSTFASLRILDNLIMNYSFAYSILQHRYETKILAYQYFPEYNNYLESHEDYALANNQVNLTYTRNLGKHSINMVASTKFYRDMVKWNLDSIVSDFESNTKRENIFTRGNMSILGEEGKAIRHINSLIGHVNYNYSGKYFISLAANNENLKEGTTRDITMLFPSLALKWDLAREPLLNRLVWLDHLNLIFNWGRSGNYPLNSLSRDLFSDEYYIYPDTVYYGYTVDNPANHKLKPEIVEGYNLGGEISLFHDRLIFQVNYYAKTNYNLIIQRDIPYYYGGGRIFINIAEMHIDGLEYKLEAFPVSQSDWLWYSRLSLSTFNQMVNKLDGSDKYYYEDDILIPDFVIKENAVLGNILGYKYLGKVENGTEEEDFENVIFVDGGMYAKPDTVSPTLGDDDKVVIGNILPDFTFDFYNSLQYKNLALDMLWYAVVGVDKFNSTRASTYISGLNAEVNDFIADTNSVIASEVFYRSSYFVEDASFLRLKTLSISYSPKKLLYDKIKWKITLGADNLVTLTRYKGYDPEATIYTDNTFSDNAIDLGAYPNPRAYYVSINLKF